LDSDTFFLEKKKSCKTTYKICQYRIYRATTKYVSTDQYVSGGNLQDNAKTEIFFKTLKLEEVHLKHYQTFEEAETDIGQFIEDVYNTKRRHSSLGYLPPVEFEMVDAQEMRY